MEFYGVRVYDMAESIVASGFPMLSKPYTPEEFEEEVKNLNYWLNTGVIEYLYNQEIKNKDKQIHRRTPNRIELFDDRAELITTDNDGNETGRFIIDHISVPKVIKHKWGTQIERKYCATRDFSLHRFLTLDEDEINNGNVIVDHIDKNTFNNKLSNLRITDRTNNVRNSSIGKNNTSGVIGVNFRKDRNKWRAFIMVDRKQISLGTYEDINEAIKARLEGELKYFGEFSPQIDLFEKYGVEIPEISNLEYKKEYNLYKAWRHFRRIFKLGSALSGSGHDCANKGIIVNVNIKADQSFWLQFERYHYQDTISSTSTMHCITKFDIDYNLFSKYTDKRVLDILKEKIEQYNENPTSDNFHEIIHNCPEGIQLTRRVTTNYLQLKTMFNQRKNHKMYAWSKDFIALLEQLPLFFEITGLQRK